MNTCNDCLYCKGKPEGIGIWRCGYLEHRLLPRTDRVSGETRFIRAAQSVAAKGLSLGLPFGFCEDYNRDGKCTKWRKKEGFLSRFRTWRQTR